MFSVSKFGASCLSVLFIIVFKRLYRASSLKVTRDSAKQNALTVFLSTSGSVAQFGRLHVTTGITQRKSFSNDLRKESFSSFFSAVVRVVVLLLFLLMSS